MNNPTSNKNFSVVQGRTFSTAFQWTGPKPTYTPINLTGAIVAGKIYMTGVDVDLTCAITDAVNGKASVSLAAATTATIVPDVYRYEIYITLADTTIKSLLYGTFNVTSFE